LFLSTQVTNIFNVFLVADLLATSLVFPAFYQIRKKSKNSQLLIPFIGSLLSVGFYRLNYIDLAENPGGLLIPTDLYGLADLNTFAVALISSALITIVSSKLVR